MAYLVVFLFAGCFAGALDNLPGGLGACLVGFMFFDCLVGLSVIFVVFVWWFWRLLSCLGTVLVIAWLGFWCFWHA